MDLHCISDCSYLEVSQHLFVKCLLFEKFEIMLVKYCIGICFFIWWCKIVVHCDPDRLNVILMVYVGPI